MFTVKNVEKTRKIRLNNLKEAAELKRAQKIMELWMIYLHAV
jgi:hypothetical protein